VATGVGLSPPEVLPSYTLYDVANGEAVHDSVAWPLPDAAVSPAGAEGTDDCGVASASFESALGPNVFTAATLK
jgi:hypothetical protein